MNRIENVFNKNKKAFIGFLVAGDPSIDKTIEYILTAEKAGVDIIEIGIPFSDPIAEGPVIQEANERALSKNIKIEQIFDMVKRLREKTQMPLVFLTYINPVYNYGIEKFTHMCKQTGIDGLIIPDLPFEEREEILPFCLAEDLDLITLVAPTSKGRIEKLSKDAKGFVYCVSSLGVTGVREKISEDLEKLVDDIKQHTNTPVAIGFGISKPEQVSAITQYADAFIVGSAIVKIIGEYGDNAQQELHDFIKNLSDAAV